MNKKWLLALVFAAPIAQAQLSGSSGSDGLEANLCSSTSSLTLNQSASAILSSLCANSSAMATAIASQGEQKDAGMLHKITQMVLGKRSATSNASTAAPVQQPSQSAAAPAAPTPAPASDPNRAGIYGYS